MRNLPGFALLFLGGMICVAPEGKPETQRLDSRSCRTIPYENTYVDQCRVGSETIFLRKGNWKEAVSRSLVRASSSAASFAAHLKQRHFFVLSGGSLQRLDVQAARSS